MPPRYVKTIKDEIFYEYAKLISRSAFKGKINYGFVTDRYKALKNGDATFSGTIREWQREQELPRECVFCGSTENLQTDHLIPKSRGGDDSADNLVLACQSCNSSRGDKGVFQWLGQKQKDKLHRLVAGKYLKELYRIHEVKGTLEINENEISELCSDCKNGKSCEEWNSVEKLSCLCLESLF